MLVEVPVEELEVLVSVVSNCREARHWVRLSRRGQILLVATVAPAGQGFHWQRGRSCQEHRSAERAKPSRECPSSCK